jgi:predicted RNase H-related nuclease YkuK (DUF458 family)
MVDIWYSPSGEIFTFEEVIGKLRSYILINVGFDFEVIIGTDSQLHSSPKSTKYVTAIVVRKIGNGAQYYYKKEYRDEVPSLRKKIWTEALLTYETIGKVKDLVSDIIGEEKVISHVDVGSVGKTKKYIDEIKSIFTNSGYDVKIKPNSYVASGVADKHSK